MTPGEIESILASERQSTIADSPDGAQVPERVLAEGVLPSVLSLPVLSSSYFAAVGAYAGYPGTAASEQLAV